MLWSKSKQKRNPKIMSSKFVFQAIGTHWQIDIFDRLEKEKENHILKKIQARISDFEKTYSRFLTDSLVDRIASGQMDEVTESISSLPKGNATSATGRYIFPDDAKKLFSEYRKMYDITLGLFTPLIGGVLTDAGYDKNYSLKQKQPLSKPPAWDSVMKFDFPKLTTNQPVQLDFGAAGKGYLIDLIGEILEENGVHSYCVDAGGDILHCDKNNQPLQVGLEHPDDPKKVIGVISVLNQSLCGSSGNRRAWAGFHHIINPENLSSPRHISAVWVLAKNTIIADILTSGLFFVSPELLKKHYDFEYLILDADYSFHKSAGFGAEMFLL
jgi:thiamine biosynthesis lipoprotein